MTDYISREFITSSQFNAALSDIREGKERIKVYLFRKVGNRTSVSGPMSPTAAKERVKALDGTAVPGRFQLARPTS